MIRQPASRIRHEQCKNGLPEDWAPKGGGGRLGRRGKAGGRGRRDSWVQKISGMRSAMLLTQAGSSRLE